MSKFMCVCCLKGKKSLPTRCQWCDRLWCSYCTARMKGDSTPFSCREGFGCTVSPTPRGYSISPSPRLSPYSPSFSPTPIQDTQSPPSSTAPSPTSSLDFPSQPTPSQPTSPFSPTLHQPTYSPHSPTPTPAAPSPSPPPQNRRRSNAADFFGSLSPSTTPIPAHLPDCSQVSAYSSQSYSPPLNTSLDLGASLIIEDEVSLEENIFIQDIGSEDGLETSSHTQPSTPEDPRSASMGGGEPSYASMGGEDHAYSANPSTQSQQTQPSQNLASEATDLPSFEEAFYTYIPTIKHIPKGARGNWAKVWSESLNPQSTKEWLLHYILPKCILPANKVIKKRGGPTHTAIIKERIRRWRKGGAKELWEEAIAITSKGTKKKQKKSGKEVPSQQDTNIRRCRDLVREGQYSKAAQALNSAGISAHTRIAYQAMKDKHPRGPSPSPRSPAPETPPLRVSSEQVLKAVNSFHPGTAPGPSGLRAEHVKEAVRSFKEERSLTALSNFTNNLLAGALPPDVAPYYSGAGLHAANKKCGGFRPVAVGEVLRRLTSKCGAGAVSERAANLLSPLQLGVGVRGGCEAIVHVVREYVSTMEDAGIGDDPDEITYIFQVDLINAYNNADREAALSEIRTHFPDLSRWLESCYGQESHLIFGDKIIQSTQGFHQGDPLASLMFAMGIQPVIQKIQENVPDLDLNTWFQDDGVLAGRGRDIRKAVQILREEGEPRGLYLSTTATVKANDKVKSTLWAPGMGGVRDPLGIGVHLLEEEGFVILGAPVGSTPYEAAQIRKKVEMIKEITGLLSHLEDAQMEYVLLRSCFSLPKTIYLLRTVDPSRHLDIWADFDSHIQDTFNRIIKVNTDKNQRLQTQLPVSMGGFGLRSAVTHGMAAFTSSVVTTEAI